MAVHDLLKGREYNQNKAVEGFDEVNNFPPQMNLVIEIELTALRSKNGRPGLWVARVQPPHGHTQQSTVPPGVAHHGARLHETHGSVRDFLGQRRGL